jgi:hypothetical protein
MLRLPALYSAMSCSIRSTSSCRVGFLRAADAAIAQERGEALCLGSLAPGETRGERVEVDPAQVDERIRINALRSRPDHVLLGSNRTIQKRVDRVGDVGDVRPLPAAKVEESLRQHANHRNGSL